MSKTGDWVIRQLNRKFKQGRIGTVNRHLPELVGRQIYDNHWHEKATPRVRRMYRGAECIKQLIARVKWDTEMDAWKEKLAREYPELHALELEKCNLAIQDTVNLVTRLNMRYGYGS